MFRLAPKGLTHPRQRKDGDSYGREQADPHRRRATGRPSRGLPPLIVRDLAIVAVLAKAIFDRTRTKPWPLFATAIHRRPILA
jgi:hypothetical protein